MGHINVNSTPQPTGGVLATAVPRVSTYTQKTAVATEDELQQDVNIADASQGTNIPEIWGTVKLSGNVIWQEPSEETLTVQSFAIAVCAGPIDDVLKIWDGQTLIYDITEHDDDNGAVVAEGVQVKIYRGEEWQAVSPLIESFEGSGNVPAHRGLAFVEFTDYETPDGAIPTFDFLVAKVSDEENPLYYVEGTTSSSAVAYSVDGTKIFSRDGRTIHVIDTTTRSILYSFGIDTSWLENSYGVRLECDEDNNLYYSSPGTGINLNAPYGCLFKVDQFGNYIKQAILPAISDLHPPLVSTNNDYPYIYMVGVLSSYRLCVMNRETFLSPTYPSNGYDAYSFADIGVTNSNFVMAMRENTSDSGDGWCYMLTYNSTVTYGCGSLVRFRQHRGVLEHEAVDITGLIPEGSFIDTLSYIAETNELLVSLTHHSLIFDADSLDYIGTVPFGVRGMQQGSVDGYIYYGNSAVSGVWGGDGGVWKYNVYTREVEHVFVVDDTNFTALEEHGLFYHRETNTMFLQQDIPSTLPDWHIWYVPLGKSSDSTVLLSDVVTDICGLCDLSPSELDVSELIDEVHGFSLTSRQTGRKCIEPLMQGYFFDGVESGGLIKFPKRGKETTAEIPEDDLACYTAGGSRPQELTTSRQQELELPISIDHTYIDLDRDYQSGNQFVQRYVPNITNQLSLDLPIVFDADEAMQVAEVTLYLAWVDRDTYSLSISHKYAYLDPCDVIEVTEDGNTHLIRIEKIDMSGGLLSVSARAEDVGVYTSNATGSSGEYTPSRISPPGVETRFVVMELPLLDFQDTAGNPKVLLVGSGLNTAWEGATATFTLGSNPVPVSLGALPTDISYGSALNTLADFQHNIIDVGNTVTVRLTDTSLPLSSITEEELLNGGNLCAIGGEVLQFQTATADGDTWILSNLLRGRFGTEDKAATHTASDAFVYIGDYVNLTTLPYSASQLLGDSGAFAVTTLNSTKTTTATINPLTIRALMPYAVDHVEAEVDYDGTADVAFSWVRRTRMDGEWEDSTDVPISEDTEEYEVDIYDDDENLLRSKTGLTTETATYTAAEQTADGVTWTAGELTLITKIYQISADVGRGVERVDTHTLRRAA